MIISIVARKGGAGKTTTAANLAAGLAAAGFVVVGVDFDPQGHLAAAFGVDPAGCGAAGWLNGAGLGSCLVSARRDRLSLVPADQNVIAAEIGAIASYSPLLAAAERLRADVVNVGADFVIVDSPTRGALQDLAVLAADLVIIPAPCDFLGASAAYEGIEIVGLWSQVLGAAGRPAPAVWVLPTLHNTRTSGSRGWLARLQGDPALPLWPGLVGVPLRAAVQRGMDGGDPVISSAKDDPAAAAYRLVCLEVIDRYASAFLVDLPAFRAAVA